MIPINFDYYRPDTLDEAVNIYHELSLDKKKPVYYGGGSEIISMSRVGSIVSGAVIDLKAIPECISLKFDQDRLYIGSAVTLSRIYESKIYKLLCTTISRIADHTNQCRITIGGNICGTIIYRESVLPLLLTDCDVIIKGNKTQRQVNINDIFDKEINLNKGEFIVGFYIDKQYLNLPFIHVKKTKNEKIDYPLISMASVLHDGKIKMAFSGFSNFPFRSLEAENILNKLSLSAQDRAEKVVSFLSPLAIDNISGSKNYRFFVLKNMLLDIITKYGEL